MAASFSDKVICLEINGNELLSPSLVDEMKRVCDDVENGGRRTRNVLLYVHGALSRSGDQRWPGNENEIDVHLVSQWEKALRRLERLPAAIIGAAEGVCGGVALEVLLATDYRLIGTNTKMHLQGPSGAMWPSMAIHRLANQLGVAQSRKLVLFGGELSAALASKIGLVDEVIDDVNARVNSFVETLGESADADIAVRRTLLLEATSTQFESALSAHLAGCDRLIRSMRRSNSVGTGT